VWPQVLGFPVQLVGLLTLPYLGVRWFVDGGDASKDIEAAAVRCSLHCLVCEGAVLKDTYAGFGVAMPQRTSRLQR
jgi:hypothetical protein